MPSTVEQGFTKFHTWLTPTQGENDAAKRHRSSIEACLKTNFEITRFFRTGSFGNGTSIRGYSDVDYFASIPREKLKNDSSVSLRIVKDALDLRFPGTGVRVNSPAIYVPFGTDASESTEIVPADYLGDTTINRSVYPVYHIPDGVGSWMNASPDAHNTYVAYVNGEKGQKVKPLIRFLKAWKFYQNVPISSFYLEMRAAKFAANEDRIEYSVDLKTLLRKLYDSDLAALQDPMGVSGNIRPCSTDVKKADSLSKLGTAVVRAEKAVNAENAGKISDAYYWWDLLFNNQFPAY
jgi:hypothetical protein